jgi:hypothetical protein
LDLHEGPKSGPRIEGPHSARVSTHVHEGPKSEPRIEGPHSAGGSTQVHEGPQRDHGHVLHKVPICHVKLMKVKCSPELLTKLIKAFTDSPQTKEIKESGQEF